MKKLILLLSHISIGFLGFAAGIYMLPILTAPPSPVETDLKVVEQQSQYTGSFKRDLKDSDALHWGEGSLAISQDAISMMGELAPGPDYKLYLSPIFVETEADFLRLKSKMVQVGDVKTFENFLVPLPSTINPANYTSVIIWCESFGQFITAAKYR